MKLKTAVLITLIGLAVATAIILFGGLVINSATLDKFSFHRTTANDPHADLSLPIPGTTAGEQNQSNGGTGSGDSGNSSNGSNSNGSGGGSTGGATGGNASGSSSNSSGGSSSGGSSSGGTTGGSSGGGSTGGGTGGGTTPSPSIASFSASPASINYNSASNLTWSSSNTTSCSISPSIGSVATSGSRSTGNLTSSTTYTLSCNGVTRQASVSVGAAPPSCGQSGGTCTAAQVAGHNSSGNCWVIYNGYYYIVTSYISNHPGGQSVFNSTSCGHDITSYMNGSASVAGKKHNHGGGAYSTLNSYRIGQVSG